MTTTISDRVLTPSSEPSPIRLEGGRRLGRHATPRAAVNLTIVTVVYNGSSLLAASVESVLALGRSDVAYLIVDGGSIDGTVNLLQSYGDKIEYWISESDLGIYNAMNKAVQFAAQGSYILFLGAGDRILKLPDSEDVTEARVAGTQMLFGDVLVGDWRFRSSLNAKLQYRNTLHHQGLLVLKGGATEPWFDETLKVFSDWDLNLRLFQGRVSAKRLNYVVAYAEPDGVSTKLHLLEIARMIRKRCGLLQALAAIAYHGGLHLTRRYAGLFRSIRK